MASILVSTSDKKLCKHACSSTNSGTPFWHQGEMFKPLCNYVRAPHLLVSRNELGDHYLGIILIDPSEEPSF